MEHNQGSPQAPEPPHWAVAAPCGMVGADVDPGDLQPAPPLTRNRRVSLSAVATGSTLAVAITFAAGWILASSLSPRLHLGATGSSHTRDARPGTVPTPSRSHQAPLLQPQPSSSRFLRGVLLSRTRTELVIGQVSGPVTVTVDAHTRMDHHLGGRVTELTVGKRVYVAAHQDANGSLVAMAVADHPFFGGIRPDGDRDGHGRPDFDHDGDGPPAIAPADSFGHHGDSHGSPGDSRYGQDGRGEDSDHNEGRPDEPEQTSRPDAEPDQWRDA